MSTIIEDIEALRAIPAEWKKLRDPLNYLAKIRAGDAWAHDGCVCEICEYIRHGKVSDVYVKACPLEEDW